MKKPNSIIAVCAPSGGGKTSLIKLLSELISDSVVITFDDYGDPFWDIPDFDKWIADGADLNCVSSKKLAEDLKSLKNGNSIISPVNKKVIEPRKYILFDSLVGRAQKETGSLIDFLAYIDVPMELALSRRILRTLSDPEIKTENLGEYLRAYSGSRGPRQIYYAIEKQVKPLSDVILDGENSIDQLADTLLTHFT